VARMGEERESVQGSGGKDRRKRDRLEDQGVDGGCDQNGS
jgi:hypothetical protein